MRIFFQFHSKLDSFQLFSKIHLLTIGIILFLCILLFVYRNALKRRQKFFRFTLAFLLLVSDVLLHLWLLTENAWSMKRDLPLQLSDLAVILAIVMLLTKSYSLFQFMYFAGLGSSIQAILTPDLGKFSFPHFQYIEFFILHGGVVLACLFMVVVLTFEPTNRSLWVTFLIVNLYAACIFILNKLLGANYLYIMKKPKIASLLNYLGPWPWYLISLEFVMILSFFILYSPFWLKRKITSN
ncbi:YwaF family protein [Neobacillus ginsengisoli]|uniref:Integral membrane protein (TIGR02206 family) n=1 Tax=Neobacillus ginsengisoli TaxID=904295 RepID=A0ABT9XQQ3_9BACI|nr:TIGR02206 family membrane protein [Neobacillus ginsengisoli]MDQ0197882.1 putative integral membrane protein (TIGR02206 family) [Neobacillus ginsengisoli]